MAIPHRTTITCPACGASGATTIADTSIGPRSNERPRTGPRYSMFGGDLWEVSRTGAEPAISCLSCGERDFITLAQQVRIGDRATR